MNDKQRIIIFEGPDRTGKTEMSIELSKRLNIPRFKNSREQKFFKTDPGYFVKALKYADPYFVSFLKQTQTSVIIDRSFPSEFVYSRVFDRETDNDMLRMVDTMYADAGAIIIVTHRTSYEGINDDQFAEIDSAVLKKLSMCYDDFIAWSSCKVLKLCVDDNNIDREMKEIMTFLDGV